MSREIKFRAWDKVSSAWVQVAWCMDIDNGGSLYAAATSPATDIEVMQFTGLKDKHGREIYEGDIILCASSIRCPHEVVWMERVPAANFIGSGMPGYYLSNMKEGYDFIGGEEVIGNIYENPELLEKEVQRAIR